MNDSGFPCGRNIPQFKKKGCPGKYWDGKEGCRFWKEYVVQQSGDKPPAVIKDCIDILNERWSFEALKLLEGNQMATETFRNGMVETGPDGRVYPKMSPTAISLMVQTCNTQQVIADNKEPRLLNG